MRMYGTMRAAAAALTALAAIGCRVSDAPERERVASDTVLRAPAAPASVPAGGWQQAEREGRLRLEISLADRSLHVFRGTQPVETHPVAIGQDRYPTPPGEYTIDQVIWNPEWIPPDSDWAEGEERRAPGDPENPLGDAQLVFQRPYSIHGTRDTASLGRAASHGSVRLSNDVIRRLARDVAEAGGAGQSEAWYREAEQERTRSRTLTLERPVPLRIVERRPG
jgi:lipoprotein-anchoring transpeptidase ErfK/SrfK